MALEDTLSTPEGYATPAQLAAQRDYAKALLYGNQQQPKVQSWTQGVSNMVNALLGRSTLNQANNAELAGLQARAAQQFAPNTGNVPTPQVAQPSAVTPPSFSEGPSSEGRKKSDDGQSKEADASKEEPFRMLPQETETWRKGVDADKALGLAATDNQPPIVQAMSAALKGNPQMAENIQVAAGRGAAPMPSGQNRVPEPAMTGQIYVDPKLVQRVPQHTEEQVRGLLANPWASEEVKSQVLQQYYQQNQPIVVPYAGGKVVIDPLNPTRQQFIPDLQTGIKKLPGGLEKPAPYTVSPVPGGPGINVNPGAVAPAPGPRSEAAPPVAPAINPVAQNADAPPATPVVPPQLAAGAAPPSAVPAAPVRVASLDPAAGVGAAAPPAQAAPQAPANSVMAQTNPLAQAIRTKPPSSDYSQEDWDSITGYQDLERQNALDKEAGVKGVDNAMKKYDTLSSQATTARKLMPNLNIADALMKDPNFYSGLGSNEVLAWNRLKAAFPSIFGKDAAYAAAPNEAFGKVIAGSILDNMKTALGGLGQVRVAEIRLLEQATASAANTPAANRALIEISRRGLTQLDRIDQMGQAYQAGDEVVNPVTGEVLLKANLNRNGEVEPRRGLDAGFDKLARKFVNENPTTTPEEAENYKKVLFDAGTPQSGKAPPATKSEVAPGTQVGEEKDFTLNGKTVRGVWDGTKWGPKP